MSRPRQRPKELLEEAARHWYWMPLTVLALGLASLALLAVTNGLVDRLLVRDIARLSSMAEIETDIAIAHLWLEEHVAGDVVEVEEINRRLERSRQGVLSMLHQSPGPAPHLPGQVDVRALRDEGLRARAKRLQTLHHRFDSLSRARQNEVDRGNLAVAGIGSEMDQDYDAVFQELLFEIDAIEALLSRRVESNRTRARWVLRAILLTWALLIALAVGGLWTRERRRTQAELALSRSEAQLLQAQKMEAVGRLAGGIAHDVNNYIAAITAQCELVRHKEEPGSYVWHKMNAVRETAFKVSSLIQRLLTFSRKLPVQPEVIDLNSVIEGLRRMVQRLIGEDIRLETDLQADLWNVKMDPTQIEQVLVNLLVNSRDAMPTGGVVRVSTRNRTVDADEAAAQPDLWFEEYVRLTVVDNGQGIPADEIDKIFEPFYTTKRQSGSSGIGLSTVYGIVRQGSGLLSVESRVGEGTAFRIDLPRTREAPAARPAVREAGERPEGAETILLVEDSEDLRAATRSVLEALGYRVTACPDGESALDTFRQHADTIDLVITDVVMPGMGGGELYERIVEQTPGVPVLFVSGYTDNVMLRHGIEENEVEFLAKPYSTGQLARKVREVLEKTRAHSRIAI